MLPRNSIRAAVSDSNLAEPLIKSSGIVYAFLPDEFDLIKDILNDGRTVLRQTSDIVDKVPK